jgi:hypothetical protein
MTRGFRHGGVFRHRTEAGQALAVVIERLIVDRRAKMTP